MNNIYSKGAAAGKEDLAQALAEILADLNVLATVAHGFHWNVKGKDFREFHDFFGEIYDSAQDAIDPVAENIQKLGFDSPYLLEDFISITSVHVDRVAANTPEAMVEQLLQINGQVHACTKRGFDIAVAADVQSIANFLADRLDWHEKMQWQLAATLGISVNQVGEARAEAHEAIELGEF